MRVFVTGANGFIGSHIVLELISSGHNVLGLTRSDAGAHALAAVGAEPHRGDLEDRDSLARGASSCDAVIHTAFDHTFSNFVENCQKDRRAIEALGFALDGTAKPFIITSGTAMGSTGPGAMATEDQFNPESPNPRVASELAGRALFERGVNVSVIRNSQIHDVHKQGLVTAVIEHARQKGISAYVDDGANCWSAAHVSDTAILYRIALERHERGARYHAVAESAIRFRDIAETIGATFALPVQSLSTAEAADHFGWLSAFVGNDMSASNTLTRDRVGWSPQGAELLSDIRAIVVA